MKTNGSPEMQNFAESGRTVINLRENHICREQSFLRAQRSYASLQLMDFCAECAAFAHPGRSAASPGFRKALLFEKYARTSGSMQFWVNPRIDESRVFTKESREM